MENGTFRAFCSLSEGRASGQNPASEDKGQRIRSSLCHLITRETHEGDCLKTVPLLNLPFNDSDDPLAGSSELAAHVHR